MSELISDNDADAEGPTDYRDEPWAKEVALLPVPERMRRITACKILLQGEHPAISDALYTVLLVFLEVTAGDDLRCVPTFTHQETALAYLGAVTDKLHSIATDVSDIAQGIDGWTPENHDHGQPSGASDPLSGQIG